MNTITKADIKRSTTAELLSWYNANSGRDPITRFADRATAEKRVRQLIDMLDLGAEPSTTTTAPSADPEPVKAKTQKAAKTVKVAKAKPKTDSDPVATAQKRAASIAKSWRVAETAAARSARHGCKVSGEVYSSVPQAFHALKLDMKKHQRVRRAMVLNGHVTFEGHRFTLVRE